MVGVVPVITVILADRVVREVTSNAVAGHEVVDDLAAAGVSRLDQVELFDIVAFERAGGKIAPATAQIGNPCAQFPGQGIGQQLRARIDAIGRENAGVGDKAAVDLLRRAN